MSSDGSIKSAEISLKAKLFGERIDIKNLRPLFTPVSTAPFTFKTENDNIVIIFRYGVVVFFGSDDAEIAAITDKISPYISKVCDNDSEETNVILLDKGEDNVEHSGTICFKEKTIERFQLCAEVLAKSVILNYYENKVSAVFENVEPLAENLRSKGKSGTNLKNLNRQTGEIILSMTKTVGRAELLEKPDVLWDFPDLERLYAKISDEYEVRERNFALQRKLDIASDAVNSFVSLSQHRHISMLDWYVIILIMLAIIVDLM
ncbi:MAG: RMD1 family protein [Alphaproteobacteria bacterium]